MERRKSIRFETDLEVEFYFTDGKVSGTVINISEDGALIKIEDRFNNLFTSADIKKKFDIALSINGQDRQTCEIIRILENDGTKIIAVRNVVN
jgi:hypothetical protein